MQIVRFICDRCHREEIEDDSLDWTQTQDGRDLCPSCVFPFRRPPMTHATMCSGDDKGHGCFVPWCTCSCHKPSDPYSGAPNA